MNGRHALFSHSARGGASALGAGLEECDEPVEAIRPSLDVVVSVLFIHKSLMVDADASLAV